MHIAENLQGPEIHSNLCIARILVFEMMKPGHFSYCIQAFGVRNQFFNAQVNMVFVGSEVQHGKP